MFLHRQRIVGAAFDRGIVRDNHALAPRDASDTGDDASGRDVASVQAASSQCRQLEEGRAWVEQ